jgi:acyl transferase domain-containing protein/acyl carrier protein/predicted O-methyltransferase YrrM
VSTSDFGERIRKLSPAKLVLLAEHLQTRLTAAEDGKREPIAIVGIGCRFPGGVTSPESFWTRLSDGFDAIREVPADRWDIDSLYDPNVDAPGKMSTRWGGFLDGIDQFDPHFFGIAPREAISMDPQQRLLLEVAWEALEHAGIPADRLMGSSTGVFVGVSGADYMQIQVDRGLQSIDTYLASGTAQSIASGRLAYVLGAQGPTFSVDTACSSSLVAVHSAVLSLRSRECDMALAGGVNAILSPVTTIALSKAQMMAPDGRCKAFDARANGFVRGEGAGMLVLKRLSDAVAAGDLVLAVIRGSAVNQDGRSNGLTAPNGPSQEAVLRAALENAQLSPTDVGYVEAHGTGTSLGDPIEVRALAAVMGRGRDAAKPLLLGSVKTNIGHLESAAGIAGLIKAVLTVRHGVIPPHKHLEQLNPFIPWNEIPVSVPTALTPWGSAGSRVAGVSSFGFSGTNAHVLLADAPPERASTTTTGQDRPLQVLTLSARSAPALRSQIERAVGDLDRYADRFADVCHTASAGRSHFPHRLALVAPTAADARAKLDRVLAGETPADVATGHLQTPRHPGIAFLFTGQGAQYPGMGRRLYETQPAFTDALDRCATLFEAELERPLLSVMFGRTEADAALLSNTAYAQPALFAIQYALATLWASWGVQPSGVMGHSVGEFAALCVSGACSLENGARLIAARARLMGALPRGGAMAALFAGPDQVTALLREGVEIAAFNGPDNTVITGPESGIDAVLARGQAVNLRGQRLDVSHAFHSSLMDPVLEPFGRVTSTVTFTTPQLTVVSNVSGAAIGSRELSAPDYLCRHLRQPVQFERGIQTLVQSGHRLFVEIGPHPVLVSMAARCAMDVSPTWLPSLRRGRDDWEAILASLASLYASGVPVDWQGFDRGLSRRPIHLSTYPFQRSRFWIERSPVAARQAEEPLPAALPGRRVAVAGIRETIFETTGAALADHVQAGVITHAGLEALAAAAIRAALGSSGAAVTSFQAREPVAQDAPRLQVVVRPQEDGSAVVEIFVQAGSEWRVVAQASGSQMEGPAPDDRIGRLLFEVAWRPAAIAEGNHVAAGQFASVQAVRDVVEPRVRSLYAEHDIDTVAAALPEIDALCSAYVAQAFKRLGWTFVPGQQVTDAEVAKRCGILPRHARLLARFLQILEEDGILRQQGDGWNVQRPPQVVDTSALARTLLDRFPSQQAEIQLTSRCGESLAEALRGDVDPLQLLFPGGSLSDTEKLYQESPVARMYNSLVRAALDAALATVPAGARCRVLEIGAGTGGTTSALLSGLPADRTEYVFTDMSRLFSAGAREKFRAYPFVRFANLDIGSDPRNQGFAAGSFDIVVAANVLHATSDLRLTLRHARSLLAPGGVLLLLEASSPERYADLTVGLTEGWWAFTDTDLRPSYALLSKARWLDVLRESGFDDAVAVPGLNEGGVLARQAVIVARADGASEPSSRQRWVIFEDGQGVGSRTSDLLAASGAEVLRVRPGERYAVPAGGVVTMDPSNAEHYRRLLTDAFVPEVKAAGVVHLWSLDASMPEAMTPDALEQSQRLASASALNLVKALAQAGKPVPLWLVTRGAQAVGPDDANNLNIVQAPVWGFGHSAALEHPELRCVRVDLDAAATNESSARDLARELTAGDAEHQVACRGSARLVRRLQWSKLQAPATPPQLRSDGTYLITGGTRGLGPVFARWMADHGARHIVLIGRNTATDEARAVIDELTARGVTICAERADVAEFDQLAAVLKTIERNGPPLRGVIHSAGTVDDALMQQQTWERMARVMAAKVRGSWHLYRLTRKCPLEFFVLFSTGVSMVGSPGQSNHGAANAFVDVLAHWMRAAGIPTVAVNWGAWADVGAAVGRRLSHERGVERFSPADGLAAFERLLQPVLQGDSTAPRQVGVLAADWPMFLDEFGAQEPPLFREIARVERRTAARADASPAPVVASFARDLAAATPSRRLAMIRQRVRQIAATVLGVSEATSIEWQQPLRELGLDSLMAVQLRNELSKVLEQPLPATLLFEYPTVKSLVDFAEGLFESAPVEAMVDAPAAMADEPMEDATEDELATALAARLDQISRK